MRPVVKTAVSIVYAHSAMLWRYPLSTGRLFVHGNNLSSLHEAVPRDVLPPELGGEGPPFSPLMWARQLMQYTTTSCKMDKATWLDQAQDCRNYSINCFISQRLISVVNAGTIPQNRLTTIQIDKIHDSIITPTARHVKNRRTYTN
uniref:Uncharacterized protein n=1 Tax=Timema poppense TaxID=170557 RepID=A0A7R9DEU7_TIMPO|nr:unnamed protein product [Timema poppensis]